MCSPKSDAGMAGPAGASSTWVVDHCRAAVPGARNGLPTSVAGTGLVRLSGRMAMLPVQEATLACITRAARGSTDMPHDAWIDVTPAISPQVGFHPGCVVRSVICAVSRAFDCSTYPHPGPAALLPIAHSRCACWYHFRKERRWALLQP